MAVELFDATFTPVAIGTLELSPQRYSSDVIGGYAEAQISVKAGSAMQLWQAANWLGHYVKISNDRQNVVWFGKLTTVEIDFGGLALGYSLDDMVDRIQITYSITDPNGTVTQEKTAWGDNLETQARYGIKEEIQSAGDSETATVTALLTTALTAVGVPIPTPAALGQGVSATLTCKGLWSTTNWRLFNQPGGVVRYEETGAFEHILGWGLTTNLIGFEGSKDRIHDLYGRLKELRVDDQIVVSGAANGLNNGTMKVKNSATIVDADNPTTHTVLVNLGISFDPTDDIKSSSNEFTFVQAYELLKVTGSPGNSGYYFAKSELAPGHITVTPGTIVKEYGGASITVEQGHSIAVTPTTLITEYPAASVTMTALGTIIAQSWTLPADVAWPITEVFIRVKRVGNPSDSLSVAIRADSAGLPAVSSLESVTVLGSTLSEDMAWIKLTFTSGITPVFGTTYWLLVARTGANSTSDFYMVDLNEDAGYAGGALKLWDGSAWVARAWGVDNKSASLPFQIWGHTETTAQIRQMLDASNQFLSTYDFQNASGKYSRLFRDADQTAQQEIATLLKAGTTNDTRLLVNVSADRVVHIFEEPTFDSNSTLLLDVYDTEHSLMETSGQLYEPGRLPTGRWVTVTGTPTNVAQFVSVARQFVERSEWDANDNKLSTLEFKGSQSPWDVVRLP